MRKVTIEEQALINVRAIAGAESPILNIDGCSISVRGHDYVPVRQFNPAQLEVQHRVGFHRKNACVFQNQLMSKFNLFELFFFFTRFQLVVLRTIFSMFVFSFRKLQHF